MRTAAFAEYQAIQAFLWAAGRFDDAPSALRDAWRSQVADEQKHYRMIYTRMSELGVGVADRPVSVRLWESLQACTTGKEFCLRIAAAEERGRRAAIRLAEALSRRDPVTASIFRGIAEDEASHVALAKTHYDWEPGES